MRTAILASKETRSIHISLRIEDEAALHKLTQSHSAIPSWVLGEAIAKRVADKGRKSIEINLSDLFLNHQV